jgi:uncharacterized protein (TIGR01319 family)
MGDIRLLIDFGSTFTKVVAVDLDAMEIAAAARVPSTVDSDITIGLRKALKEVERRTGGNLEEKEALACSSAAGGLRMICTGFVPELTSQAASEAALGAGAKVIGAYSYKLNRREIGEIEAAAPDIILLCGGTDGGDEAVICHNAGLLAATGPAVTNIIVAGNKAARDAIRAAFADTDKNVIYTGNVMPEVGVLDAAPCQREIRELFMRHIVRAKGIAQAREMIKDVIMPTPAAVLEAAKLISGGHGGDAGLGELIVVDVGGATTDVHSVARGAPARADTIMAGLPEPYEKRTVEGDLGLRYNLDRLLELIGDKETPPGFKEAVAAFRKGRLPRTAAELASHRLLTSLTVEAAVARHAGRLEVVYSPAGERLIQHGKDLTGVRTVIGTGGPLVFARKQREILAGARFREENPFVLKPKDPAFYLDGEYVLFAVGLLAQAAPDKALRLARKYLRPL